MKRTSMILLVVMLVISFVAVEDVHSGWFGKKDKDKDKKYLPRFDRYPSLGFHQGVMSRSVHSGWRVGDLDVQFKYDCTIVKDGVEGVQLQEGRPVIITGPRFGNTVIAWRVRILNWDKNYGNYDPNITLQKSEITPYLAVGSGPE